MSTVLIVDDQPQLRQLFQRVLEHDGCGVVTADNGQDALRLLETRAFDLVLLDMAMPQMDGLTFLRLVRQRPQWAAMPVIVLSGLMTPQQVAEARALGVTDQLIKAEFSMRELRSRVARHLATRSTAA